MDSMLSSSCTSLYGRYSVVEKDCVEILADLLAFSTPKYGNLVCMRKYCVLEKYNLESWKDLHVFKTPLV
jgi:hypothetical protein